MWVAWRLPKPLVKWALVRATVNATTGKWASQVLPEVTAVEVMDRWDNEPGTDGWNPWNKVVHREGGEVDPVRTNIERALRGLPVPWHPRMADKEVGEGPLEVDLVEMELAQHHDGLTFEPGDKVLLTNSKDVRENGVYVVSPMGVRPRLRRP